MRCKGGHTQQSDRLEVPNIHCPHKQSPSLAWDRALLSPSPPRTRLTSKEDRARLQALPVGIIFILPELAWAKAC